MARECAEIVKMIRCNFCGNTPKQCDILFQGMGKVAICDQCIELATEGIKEKRKKVKKEKDTQEN